MWNALRHRLHLLVYSWRTLGPHTLARSALRWTLDPEAREVDRGFDVRYGTDTSAEVTPEEAAIPEDRRHLATMYLPSMERDLDAMLDGLAWPAERLASATFVDIGSGKARVVLLGAMRRFREVVGIELSPVLHEIALHNLRVMRRAGALASPVRLQLGDAVELDVPDGPFIAYLYHPFREPVAAEVVDRLVGSLAASPRPAAILYGHPTIQRPMDPAVFARGDMFRLAIAGERRTRHFRVGWSVWTNEAWLASAACALAEGA